MNSRQNSYHQSDSDEETVIKKDGKVYNAPTYEAEPIQEDEEQTTPDIKQLIIYPNSLFTNARPLNKLAKTYELETFEKNLLIIINQKYINGFEPRLGTEKDVGALRDTFTQFGFEIEEHHDKTKAGILSLLDRFSYRNFSDYGCVAVVVLTHGSFNGLLRAKDDFYKEFDIVEAFTTDDKPSLVTKPKLLIVQACRGEQSSKSVEVGNAKAEVGPIKKDSECRFEPYALPAESDMYILHSSYMGKASYRNENRGTWLIQTLCKKINDLAATDDLVSIVTEVKREVAIDKAFEEYNTDTLEFEKNIQAPVDTSTLIRKLYFRKYSHQPLTHSDSTSEVQEPITPIVPSVQFGPCTCSLDYFEYITECLRLYLERNPDDEIAQYFVEAAKKYDVNTETGVSRDSLTNAIVKYIRKHAKEFDFYQYIYFINKS